MQHRLVELHAQRTRHLALCVPLGPDLMGALDGYGLGESIGAIGPAPVPLGYAVERTGLAHQTPGRDGALPGVPHASRREAHRGWFLEAPYGREFRAASKCASTTVEDG